MFVDFLARICFSSHGDYYHFTIVILSSCLLIFSIDKGCTFSSSGILEPHTWKNTVKVCLKTHWHGLWFLSRWNTHLSGVLLTVKHSNRKNLVLRAHSEILRYPRVRRAQLGGGGEKLSYRMSVSRTRVIWGRKGGKGKDKWTMCEKPHRNLLFCKLICMLSLLHPYTYVNMCGGRA